MATSEYAHPRALGCVSEDVDLDAMRQRAAQIIVESIAWDNAS